MGSHPFTMGPCCGSNILQGKAEMDSGQLGSMDFILPLLGAMLSMNPDDRPNCSIIANYLSSNTPNPSVFKWERSKTPENSVPKDNFLNGYGKDWRAEYYKKILPVLVQYTKCTENLLNGLKRRKLLTDTDMKTIVSNQNTAFN